MLAPALLRAAGGWQTATVAPPALPAYPDATTTGPAAGGYSSPTPVTISANQRIDGTGDPAWVTTSGGGLLVSNVAFTSAETIDVYSNAVTFAGCDFNNTRAASSSVPILLNLRGTGPYLFDHCSFRADGTSATRIMVAINQYADCALTVQNCDIAHVKQAVNITGNTIAGVSITGNYMHDCVYFTGDHTEHIYAGAVAGGSNITITGNTFLNPLTQTAAVYFHDTQAFTNCTISREPARRRQLPAVLRRVGVHRVRDHRQRVLHHVLPGVRQQRHRLPRHPAPVRVVRERVVRQHVVRRAERRTGHSPPLTLPRRWRPVPIPPDTRAPGDDHHVEDHNAIADELTALVASTAQKAGLLTPTAVKTAGYTAAAGDLVPVDTTSGNVTITLPAAPADLAVVAVKHVTQGAANTVTVACAGSDVFNKTGGATSGTLTLLAQGMLLQYKAAGGIWYVTADDLALTQLDSRYTTRQAGTSGVAVAPLSFLNPKDDGAAFDGSTDDSTSLGTTLARGNTILFPPGTTVVNANQLKFQTSNAHIRGAGMYDTTIRCTSGSLSTLWVYPGSGSFINNVELSDMTLDGTNVAISAIAQLGNRLDRLRIRRCRFVNWPSVIIQAGYAAEIIIEDCEVDGAGTGLGTFFFCTNREFESVIIRRNRIRWVSTGITIGSGNPTGSQYHSAYIDIADNYIDLGWWLLKAASARSGGTVTYTSTTVTDTAASFGTIAAGTTVRALTPLQAGTLTTVGTQVTNASANFTGNNVWRGHIVRSGTAFAVVSKVETATQLHVEEWLDQTTYQPVTPPSSAAYTIYGVTLGATASNTATAITVAHGGGGNGGGWYDLQGTSVTPSAGTLYEVLPAHPVYPIFINVPVEKVKITGNTVRRGWADNIEFFGSRGIITGNIVEDGQDEGIVVQGYSTAFPGLKTIVSGNICRHNGTSGLDVLSQADCEIGPNQYEDNAWGTPSSFNVGQIQLANCVNTTVTGGRATTSGECAINQAGLQISGSSTSGVKVLGFSGHSAAVGDVLVQSTVPAGTCDLLDIDGVIAYQGTTNGQRLRVKGTGTPTLIASPGSQFLSTSGSGAGTTLYVKESGNDSTGWTVMGATVTPSVQLATATGSYTWTKPAGAQVVDVILCAAGGGGASGAIAITGNAGGGGGGGGGALAVRSFAAADLPGSVTGSVGTGGNGGSAASGTGAASGSNGVGGGTTTFGAFAFAGGGNVGAQGTTTGGAGGAATDSGTSRGGTGGAGGTGVAGVSSAAWGAATGGGGGGGATTAAGFNGGTGQFSGMGGAGNTGTAGVAGGASPGTGTQPAVKGTPSCGGGGGAGANGASPTAQTGATAFFGGGGGGGGGAFIASGTGTSGAGGKGGDGFALIVTHFA